MVLSLRRKFRAVVTASCLAMIGFASGADAQQGAVDGEWHYFGGDPGCTRYSPLDQITADNIDQLQIVWRWDSPDARIQEANPRVRPSYFKATPLMVDGVLYTSTPLNQVAAINAGTGETIWVYDPKAYERTRRSGSGFQNRGLGYWTDGEDARIYIATKGRQLVALNAKTGKTYPGFGDGGWVDLGKGLGNPYNYDEQGLSYSAPPMVVGDTVVLGNLAPDEATIPNVPPGYIRGFDARTGDQKWVFHTIPREGEFGVGTWAGDSWKHTGAANNWSTMSADPELGYVYVPTGTPANDFYGGHRVGDNLFAESVICLDADTGERVWHFQGVHHGLWDYDFPAAPQLVDIVVDGEPVKALAQTSKQGFLYVLNRVTGQPIWPIVERPVPQSDVPGEVTSPTQPFPTKPAPYERQGIAEGDLIDFTPELRAEALKIVEKFKLGPIFTPPALTNKDGTGGVIQVPGAAGGANWGSAGYDAETGIIYIQSGTVPSVAGLIKPDSSRSTFDYIRGGPWMINGPLGLPLTKPPYGRVTAIDLNSGEHAWQVPHGDGPRDHPLIKHLDLGPLGAPSNTWLSSSGPVVTKTLVIYSQVEVEPDSSYSKEKWFLRAYDKKTGDLVWKMLLPLPPYAVPMTYMHQGRQFIAVGAGGAGEPGGIIALALPESAT